MGQRGPSVWSVGTSWFPEADDQGPPLTLVLLLKEPTVSLDPKNEAMRGCQK